jgi:hypothetical protein
LLIGTLTAAGVDSLIRGVTQWLTLEVPTVISTYVTHETLQQSGTSLVPISVIAVDILAFAGGAIGSYLLIQKCITFFRGEN